MIATSPKLERAIARSRARDGFASMRPAVATPAPRHVVTISERPCHDGELRYDYSCSCGFACGTRDTDAEARQASKEHEPTQVQIVGRAQMPFSIVAANPRTPRTAVDNSNSSKKAG